MAPHGKTPSLIGSGAGNSRFVVAIKKRTCKRCKAAISGGTNCVEVSIPGSFGSKTYCRDCYSKIIEQSKVDLANLETQFKNN
jgi:RNase P subunit RPR2